MGYVGDQLIAVPVIAGTLDYSGDKRISGYIEFSEGTERIPAGSTVTVQLVDTIEHIQNTILFIGSHDPLVDEISKMLIQRNSPYILSSADVGSMGGIQAIRRGEAHLTGIHLQKHGEIRLNIDFFSIQFYNFVTNMQALFPDDGTSLFRRFDHGHHKLLCGS